MSDMILLKAHAVAMHEEMALDNKVICIGEDIGINGGIWKTFSQLYPLYGDSRVIETPMEEAGYSLFAAGTAMMGYRPVVEIMFADFCTLAFEAIVDVCAKYRYNAEGRKSLPITFILPQGIGAGSGAHHSQSVESWFANVPGLKIVAPTTPADVRAYLREVPDQLAPEDVPSLKNAAKIVKEGADVTLVAYQRSLAVAQAAVAEFEAETGKTVEIIDPRVLIPFDKDKMFASLKKTGRLLVSHDAPERGGYGSQIIAWAVEEMGTDLKNNPVAVCGKNIVIPFNNLEQFVVPQKDDIKAGLKKVLGIYQQ